MREIFQKIDVFSPLQKRKEILKDLVGIRRSALGVPTLLSQAAASLVSFKETSLDLPAILMLGLLSDLLSCLLSFHGEVILPVSHPGGRSQELTVFCNSHRNRNDLFSASSLPGDRFPFTKESVSAGGGSRAIPPHFLALHVAPTSDTLSCQADEKVRQVHPQELPPCFSWPSYTVREHDIFWWIPPPTGQ